ncbi:hypothetical protein ACHAW5_000193 [Stephanodiscus triporus]|uniref:Cap-specific mRNA (nucleoside-2'-O-)-methyltransferase 1 n=1 Tax=Stephanodiscus triporus TaxID=2934178 RepID=A0ABD3N7X8_9STRA
MGRRKRQRKQLHAQASSSASAYAGDGARLCEFAEEDDAVPEEDLKSVRSSLSWFRGVTWVVGRRDDARAVGAVPSATANDGAGAPAGSTGSGGEPTPRHHHSHLPSELGRIKLRLAPSAQACADAVNRRATPPTPDVTTREREFRLARSACNPHESMWRRRGDPRFVNRSAIKLANIDALLGFVLTSPGRTRGEGEGEGGRRRRQDFVFVDLCGAPGGFSEYILHRRRTRAPSSRGGACYGFGMSLSGVNVDGEGLKWDLDHIMRHHLRPADADGAGSGSFYRVCHGADGTGSVYNWDNVLRLRREVFATVAGDADPSGVREPLVDLVVADGGFDAQRDVDDQESAAHGIVVSQAAAALTLLRPGGTFVLKMFGFRLDGTRRMLRRLCSLFDRMTFAKPISSRPASAERYLAMPAPGEGWDGLIWREQMMTHSPEPRARESSPLEELMDSFDREMLQLNINACRSIVNYLDEKKESVERGDNSSDRKTQRYCLDSKVFEEARR